MKKLNLTEKQRYIIFTIQSSIVNVLVLVFSILALNFYNFADSGDISTLKIFMALSFLSLSFATVNSIILNRRFKNNKIAFVKYIVFVIVYFALFFAMLFIPEESAPIGIVCAIFVLTIFANRLCKIFEVRRPFNIIFNSFLSLLAALVFVVMMLSLDMGMHLMYIVVVDFMIVFVALINILMYAFSRIQLGSLVKIIRKTHAIETIYGLFVLVFTFSFVFTIYDPETFHNYGDALWYCFAVVTTIGFGDISPIDPISRILSIILGLYGIIVVAIVTSVIVNFYTEIKNKPDDENVALVAEKEIEELEKEDDKQAEEEQNEESHS